MSEWPYKVKVESRTADRRVTGDEGHAMVKALRAELDAAYAAVSSLEYANERLEQENSALRSEVYNLKQDVNDLNRDWYRLED